MAILKCKMCGGDLEVASGVTVAECTFCGTKQTLPKVNGDVVQNLFNRANALRLKCEFDKAEQIYEKILQQNNGEAEAHWGIVLCKYGIEYVEDPKTFQRIPTCHRTSYDAVTADGDYLAAVEYADAQQRSIYQSEARVIDRIQKNILSIVKDEKPFDVFLCYKETDENGKRTVDSSIANDIYHQLTMEGLKVFYSAITLEDKLGQEYEPYIFAALNSARVMLVIGTKPHHFTAVWVKNEWSRFLKLMKTNHAKLLIPCYRDMDAYELPEEFAHLQAQDMSKIGFISDVVRGIKKVAAPQSKAEAPAVSAVGSATAPLLKRAFMFLEDGDWNSANEYCEKVLDAEPENAQAYLGKLMAEQRVKKQEALKDCPNPFDGSNNYQKALRFGDEALKTTLAGHIEHINTRNENARIEGIYSSAKSAMASAKSENDFKNAAQVFATIREYKDAATLEKQCNELAEQARKNDILATAKTKMSEETVSGYQEALELLASIPGWKDADEQAEDCKKLKAKAEKKQRTALIAVATICAIIVFIVLLVKVIIPTSKYKHAVKLMEDGKYTEAISAFERLGDYKDSKQKILECNYGSVESLLKNGNKAQAAIAFAKMGSYQDAKTQSKTLWDEIAVRATIDSGICHTVGLKSDGTVVAVGRNYAGRCDVGGWTDIIAISAGKNHTVGLKSDGTVVAVGYSDDGRYDVGGWTDIVAISAGDFYTVGLKSDGTVVAVGDNYFGQCDVSDWTDIVAISAGKYHTVGLKSDGTVVAEGSNAHGRSDVGDWTDIVAISAGDSHTVGLKSDGTVVAVGDNYFGQCDVSDWTDIVAISAGYVHTVGLKSDGTVVAVGSNDAGRCDVGEWMDIVAISAGSTHTVGLKSDGTLVAVGNNDDGQCDVDDWTNIRLP